MEDITKSMRLQDELQHPIVQNLPEESSRTSPAAASVETADVTKVIKSAQTLSSEAVLEALKMILAGAPLNEVLTIVAGQIEAQSEGMLCSIFLLDKDGIHL